MKAESEKLKSRTSLSMNDADWKLVQTAAKLMKEPLSQFLRKALAVVANTVIISRKANGKDAK